MGVCPAHWNGTAAYFDHEHWPLIVGQETELPEFIVLERTSRKAVAPDGSGCKRERLPGMPNVMQAVSISPITILPRFTPGNAGQDECEWGRTTGQRRLQIAGRALLGHVRRRPIMIQTV